MTPDEAREALVSDLSHELERWFGPNLTGWPANPTKYFGTPARDAVTRIYAEGVAEGIRRARATGSGSIEVERPVNRANVDAHKRRMLEAIEGFEKL